MYLVGYTAARIIACTTPIQTRLLAVTLFSTKKKMNDINFESKPITSVSFSDDTYGEAEMRLTRIRIGNYTADTHRRVTASI